MKNLATLLMVCSALLSGCVVYDGHHHRDGDGYHSDRDYDGMHQREGMHDRDGRRDRDGDGVPDRRDHHPDDARR